MQDGGLARQVNVRFAAFAWHLELRNLADPAGLWMVGAEEVVVHEGALRPQQPVHPGPDPLVVLEGHEALREGRLIRDDDDRDARAVGAADGLGHAREQHVVIRV